MLAVATQNLGRVETVIASDNPGMADVQKRLGEEKTRLLLRYQAAEMNRFYFDAWGWAQLTLGTGLTLLLLFGTSVGRAPLIALALALVVSGVQHFLITPQVSAIGRMLDFRTRTELPAERSRFGAYHGAYTVMELIKLGFVLGVGVGLLRERKGRPRGRSRGRNEVLTSANEHLVMAEDDD
jgi:hypothetical protein